MRRRTLYSSGGLWEAKVGYSRAVRYGDSIAVAGCTGVDADGNVVGAEDAYLQARQALDNVAAALEKAGTTLASVIRTRMYVVDIQRDWRSVGRAHAESFADIRPAATMVEVAGLIDPQMLVEIEVDAWVGDES